MTLKGSKKMGSFPRYLQNMTLWTFQPFITTLLDQHILFSFIWNEGVSKFTLNRNQNGKHFNELTMICVRKIFIQNLSYLWQLENVTLFQDDNATYAVASVKSNTFGMCLVVTDFSFEISEIHRTFFSQLNMSNTFAE